MFLCLMISGVLPGFLIVWLCIKAAESCDKTYRNADKSEKEDE